MCAFMGSVTGGLVGGVFFCELVVYSTCGLEPNRWTLKLNKGSPKTQQVDPQTQQVDPKAQQVSPKPQQVHPKAQQVDPPTSTGGPNAPCIAILCSSKGRSHNEQTKFQR